ncbi:MAG: rod shape-determining protein MreD [Nitrospirota bacterium]|nr:rod shape-determining protein MreD [Nitrospirota bacterium]
MEISLRGIRYRWLIGVSLFLIPLQGSILDLSLMNYIRPDMALVAAYVAGFILAPLPASFLGFIAGALTDILSGAAVGINAFSKMLTGMLAASSKNFLFLNRALAHASMLFVLSSIDGLITSFFLIYFYDGYILTTATLRVVIMQALYTSLVGTIAILTVDPFTALARKIKKWMMKEQTNAVRGV